MSNKLTPLQEAIEVLKTKIYDDKSDTAEAWNNGIKKAIYIIESLLPAETAFAKEAWDAGMTYERHYYDYTSQKKYPDFNQFISKYNQEK